MVERLNGTLKAKLNKICKSTKLNWIDALPLALMSYRMQTNRNTHLTLHEMLTGRPMPVPYCRGPYKGPPLEQLQMELRSYMKKLTAILSGVRRDRRSTETGISSKRGLILHQGPQAVKTFNSRQNSMENTGLIKETETEEQMR